MDTDSESTPTAAELAEQASELGRLGFSPSETRAALGMTALGFGTVDGGRVWQAYLSGRVTAQRELRQALYAKAVTAGRIGAARAVLGWHKDGSADFDTGESGELLPLGYNGELADAAEQAAAELLAAERRQKRAAAKARRAAAQAG